MAKQGWKFQQRGLRFKGWQRVTKRDRFIGAGRPRVGRRWSALMR
jgi:hypothetical protein